MLTEDLYVLCFALLCQLLVPVSVSVCVCELASLFCVCFGENDHIGKVRAVVSVFCVLTLLLFWVFCIRGYF